MFKALNKTRGLYIRWQDISKTPAIASSSEVEWTSTELRNALRSIEWDLEDLEDTISIVEKNSSKFKIDNKEICDRRTFIEATKQEVKVMKNKINLNRNRDNDGTAREPLLGEDSPNNFPNVWSSTPKYTKYSKLANSVDSPSRFDLYDNDIMSMQGKMLADQNEQLQVISKSVGSLKTVSTQIGIELDEQADMLDDLNADLENTDSKLDSAVKKIAKVFHMTNDQRQWMAMGILFTILFLIILLFILM